MNEQQRKHTDDPGAVEALREEANKPEPLYEKTNRNFQRAEQDAEEVQPQKESRQKGSSSSEEKDITV